VKTKIGLRIFIIVTLPILLSLSVPPASPAEEREAEINISVGSSFGKVTLRPKVKPFSAFKDRNIVKQQLDYSCGAASVATIFNYYLGVNISEKDVIDGMFRVGNADKIIERKGFSLLDMKRFAESMGHKAAGYRTDVEGLITLNRPSIVPIVIRDYKHFVIFRGVANGRVFLADPAFGNITFLIGEFERIWHDNVALVIKPKNGEALDVLKITEKDMIMVGSDEVRRALFYHSVLFPKGAREF
jgi:predicted double-glycine peptidase